MSTVSVKNKINEMQYKNIEFYPRFIEIFYKNVKLKYM